MRGAAGERKTADARVAGERDMRGERAAVVWKTGGGKRADQFG